MTDEMKSLLLQIAGYLRLIERGYPVSQSEATGLLEKIEALMEKPSTDVYVTPLHPDTFPGLTPDLQRELDESL